MYILIKLWLSPIRVCVCLCIRACVVDQDECKLDMDYALSVKNRENVINSYAIDGAHPNESVSSQPASSPQPFSSFIPLSLATSTHSHLNRTNPFRYDDLQPKAQAPNIRLVVSPPVSIILLSCLCSGRTCCNEWKLSGQFAMAAASIVSLFWVSSST